MNTLKIILINIFMMLYFANTGNTQLTTQDSLYLLPLKTGDKVIHENINNIDLVKWKLNNQCFDGKFYVLLQFYQLPDVATHKRIQELGIDLTQYLAANTYRATIPEDIDVQTLAELNIRAVDELTALEKIAPLLLLDSLPKHVEVVPSQLDVRLKLEKNTTGEAAMEALQIFGVEYLKERKSYDGYLIVRILQEKIEDIAAMPFTNYIHSTYIKGEPLGAARGTAIRSEYLNCYDDDMLKGKGVIVAIVDEGDNTDHIDLSNVTTNLENPVNCYEHTAIIAGIIGAQGILYPTFQGVAPKSEIKAGYNYNNGVDLYIDHLASQGTVIATSSQPLATTDPASSGEYSDISQIVDQQHQNNPQLIQVVAVGNGGTIPSLPWGSVRGGRQSAKNPISVGGISTDNIIVPNSSEGPTLDGRLKPEIVAIGVNLYTTGCYNQIGLGAIGTSFASPQVAGGLALLYEYYRDNPSTIPLISDTHPNPNAGLMKAIACNTADDLGSPGPDYTYGFGKMNLRKAKKALEEHWYGAGEFPAGIASTSTRTLHADSDVYALKVMLYWVEQPTDPMLNNTYPHLINDLNLSVTDVSNNYEHFPLILNPMDPALPAVEGSNDIKDNLNNIEQVVIKAAPGQFIPQLYHINVNTQDTPQGNQRYYLTWEFIKPGITITSPYPGEVIANGGVSAYYIEWDYYGDEDDANNGFRITITDGSGYEKTADVAGNLRIYKWDTCDQLDINSSNVTVKIERLTYSTENTFSVYNAVKHNTLKATYLCNNQVCLSWSVECSVGNTTYGKPPAYFKIYKYVKEYDEQFLGYMEPILTTSDYSATIEFDPTKTEEWYAVSTTYYDNTDYIETTRCNAKRFIVPISSEITACSGSEICVLSNCPSEITGTSCNDDNLCTINDVYDEDCNCTGVLIDDNNNDICDIDECINIELYAYLEGVFDIAIGEMTTTLNTQRSILPGQTPATPLVAPTPAGQPYYAAPWNYTGTEGQNWTDADYTGVEVDWVMVSFRTGISSDTEVARTAALINKDGSVNFIDRCVLSPPLSSVFIVLEHRNHMGVMTPQAIDVDNGYLCYDFRISNSYRDATSFGQKQLSDGVWGLYAGDGDQNDTPSFDINGTDKGIWFDNNGIFDNYLSSDYNLDGDINGQDKAIWGANNGLSSRVPK